MNKIVQVTPTDMGRCRAQLFCRLVYDYHHDPVVETNESGASGEKDKQSHAKMSRVSGW